jgi:hypothetical protein
MVDLISEATEKVYAALIDAGSTCSLVMDLDDQRFYFRQWLFSKASAIALYPAGNGNDRK